jgi:hypothetical protein
LQLIEIIQLVLIGFIVISLIIFGFSYFGYRRRTKSIPVKKPKQMEILIKPEIDPAKVDTPIQTPDLETTSEDLGKKTGILKKNKKKFEVFKPSTDDSPVLQSKAISIKPPQKSK